MPAADSAHAVAVARAALHRLGDDAAVYRGRDAAEAVAALGCCRRCTTRRTCRGMEYADLCTALELPGDEVPDRAGGLEASMDAHVVRWHPFRMHVGPRDRRAADGDPGVGPAGPVSRTRRCRSQLWSCWRCGAPGGAGTSPRPRRSCSGLGSGCGGRRGSPRPGSRLASRRLLSRRCGSAFEGRRADVQVFIKVGRAIGRVPRRVLVGPPGKLLGAGGLFRVVGGARRPPVRGRRSRRARAGRRRRQRRSRPAAGPDAAARRRCGPAERHDRVRRPRR